MKYRSRTEIISDMLQAAKAGATKTHLMYRAFLSYAQLVEYIKLMLDSELLEYRDDTHKFHTTEKGRKFTELHDQIGMMVLRKK